MMTDEVRLDKVKGFKPTEATACCKFCRQLINISIQDYRTEEDKEELPPRIRDEPKAVLNISTTKDGTIKINVSKKYENEIEI